MCFKEEEIVITPIEIQSKVFKAGLGYDKKEVDMFLSDILVDFEKLYKENIELNDKLNVVNEGIHYYKTIEKTLQKALVLAEKVAEETKEAAKEEARNIEFEARNKAKMIVSDAKHELENLHAQTLSVIRQYDIYKAQFKKMAMAQLEILDSNGFNLNMANLDVFTSGFAKANELNNQYNSKEENNYTDDETKRIDSNKVNKAIDGNNQQEKKQDNKKNINEEENASNLPRLSEEEILALVLADEAEIYG